MSHFISNCQIPGSPIFPPAPPKNFVSSKYRHILHSPASGRDSMVAVLEEAIITRLCKKLTDRQFFLLRQQNAKEMQRQMSKLKGKLKKQLDSNALSVDRFFKPGEARLTMDIKKLTRGLPEKVDLERKYSHKLSNYRAIAEEAKGVLVSKEGYRNWSNFSNNSPVKSPNYRRMNFVLERLSQDENDVIKPREESKENGVAVRRKRRGYAPKWRKIKTEHSELL